jgi:NAD(P)-dependent dehydrogenase (short-subunit alcohol dehydrogenase family)
MKPETPSSIGFGLAQRVCIVTGGAQGIGRACSERFAREKARLVIADIDAVQGQALAAQWECLFLHCDVGDKAQVDALVAHTTELAAKAVLTSTEAKATSSVECRCNAWVSRTKLPT